MMAAGNRGDRGHRCGSIVGPGYFPFLYMVRPGADEALAQPDEDEIPDAPPQLQALVTARSLPAEPRARAAHAVAGH